MNHADPIHFPTAPVKPRRFTFQISIKSLMITTAVVAVFIGMCLAPTIAAIVMALTHAALLGCSVIAAIRGRGWIRPFAIIFGLYLAGLMFFVLAEHFPGPEAFAIVETINIVIATVVGLCGAIFHSYLARRNGFIPVPNLPFLRNWLVNDPQQEQSN